MILNKYLTTYQGLKIHVVIPESLTYFEWRTSSKHFFTTNFTGESLKNNEPYLNI